MVDLISRALQLALLIIENALWKKKRARELKMKYEADMAEFEKLAAASLTKMLSDARRESGEARDIEDAIDRDRKEWLERNKTL